YDLTFPQLKLIIEVHGEQHYKPQTFGGTAEEAISSFQGTKRRDNRKKEIAEDNDWVYLILPFSLVKTLTGPLLEEQIINVLKN
ncbi:hypothetical protein LRR18_17575, partial [Mangrovimonas sp. AS39]|nr:hypothetical protein [Mangrovimonas futianensis]